VENILNIILGGAIKTLKCILNIINKNLVRAILNRELAKTLGIGCIRLDILFSF